MKDFCGKVYRKLIGNKIEEKRYQKWIARHMQMLLAREKSWDTFEKKAFIQYCCSAVSDAGAIFKRVGGLDISADVPEMGVDSVRWLWGRVANRRLSERIAERQRIRVLEIMKNWTSRKNYQQGAF